MIFTMIQSAAAGGISWELIFDLYEIGGWTGALCRLRRGGDNVEADFYQGASAGDLNTTRGGGGTDALTWVTQGSGDGAGYGRTFYDQSGNANDLIQSTSGSQLALIESSAYNTIGGNPAFKSTASGKSWNLTNTIDITTQDVTVIDVKRSVFASQTQPALQHASTANPYFNLYFTDGNMYTRDGVGYVVGAVGDSTTDHTYTSTIRSGSLAIYKETTLISGSFTSGSGSTVINCYGGNGVFGQYQFFHSAIRMQVGDAIDYSTELAAIRTYYGT
jgi:hypothetical protein